jgi:hypothetical protein
MHHQDDSSKGLYRKYDVRRTDGRDAPGEKHEGCLLFVLDLDHDPFAMEAIKAYALTAQQEGYGALASDLLRFYAGNDHDRDGVREKVFWSGVDQHDSEEGRENEHIGKVLADAVKKVSPGSMIPYRLPDRVELLVEEIERLKAEEGISTEGLLVSERDDLRDEVDEMKEECARLRAERDELRAGLAEAFRAVEVLTEEGVVVYNLLLSAERYAALRELAGGVK